MIKIPESVSPNTPAIQRKLSWILPSALLVLLLIGDIMHYQGQRNVLTRMAKDESRLTTARMITHIRDLGFYIQDHMELMTTWLATTSDSELNVFFEAADNNFTMWDGYYQGIVFWEEHSEEQIIPVLALHDSIADKMTHNIPLFVDLWRNWNKNEPMLALHDSLSDYLVLCAPAPMFKSPLVKRRSVVFAVISIPRLIKDLGQQVKKNEMHLRFSIDGKQLIDTEEWKNGTDELAVFGFTDSVSTYGQNWKIAIQPAVTGKVPDLLRDIRWNFFEDLARTLIATVLFGVALVAYRRMRDSELKTLESEKQYRNLFNRLGNAIIIHTLDSTILEVNESACTVLLVGKEDLIGRAFTDIISAEQKAKFSDRLHNIQQRGHHIFQSELCSADKVLVPMEISAELSEYHGQTVVVNVCRDLTERRQAREALEKSEKTLRSLLQAAPIGIGQVKDRILGWVNDNFVKMTGFSQEELQGKSARFLYPTEEEFERVGRVKHADVNKYGTGSILTQFKRKDGSLIDILLGSTALERENPSAGMVFTALDITEQRSKEQVMLNLATALEQSSEAIVVTDLDGEIEYINPSFERMTGYSRDELLGQNSRIVKSGKQDLHFYQDLWATIQSGNIWKGQFINKRKDGNLYRDRTTITPVRGDDGQVVKYVAIKQDVTNEGELEAQLRQSQKLESVGRLAGGIAHDFNNLLSVILGYSEIALEDMSKSEPTYSMIREIYEAGDRAQRLTRQLLAFSRKQMLQVESLNLNTVVLDLEKMLRRLISEDITLSIHLSPDDVIITADRAQVEQVIMNLVVNARDAMTDSGILSIETEVITAEKIQVINHSELAPGTYGMLVVSDSGHGMDEDVLQQIFEPFFTTKEVSKGTGLGLSTVHGIVKQHGGDIAVTSVPGTGTTFQIYLPAVPTAASVKTETASEPTTAIGHETVLVVEDDALVRDLAYKILRKHGYDAYQVDGPDAAIEFFTKFDGQVHLLLTDIIMPKMNGRDLYQQLARQYKDLRVLFMSGYSDDVVSHQEIQASGVPFIQKPFTVRKLLKQVSNILEG